MSLVTNLQTLATRIATEFKTVYGRIGSLPALTTTAKSDLVAAINEVNNKPLPSGGAQINDTGTSLTSVWSSTKTDTEIGTRVAAVVNSAPTTLDTLDELANALGDDPNFATSTATALGNRVRVDAAQTFTGPQQAQARSNIGAGTSNLVIGTAAGTAKDGAWKPASADITDSTATGRSVLTATDATAARTAIGAGTSNLAIGTTASTAMAGNTTFTAAQVGAAPTSHTHTAANISDSSVIGRTVLTAADAAAVRTAIGAGTGNSNLAIGTTSTTAKAGDYTPPADGLAGVATMRTLGTGATQAAAGNDPRLSDARTPTAHTHVAANISDSTTVGRAVLTAIDAAAARTAIGAGTGSSNLVIGTTAGTAKDGAYQPTAANISDATAVGRSVLTAVDAAAVRSAIGAGTSSLAIGTTASTAMAGNTTFTAAQVGAAPAVHTHVAANITDSTATGRSVLTAIDGAAARTAIGAGTSSLTLGTTLGTAADASTVGDTSADFVTTFEAGLV